MFEIINNIVKELNQTKELCRLAINAQDNEAKVPIDLCCAPMYNTPNPEKIIVSDVESDSESESESESEYESDDCSDSEDDECRSPINIIDEPIATEDNIKIISVDIGDTIEVSESDVVFESADEYTIEEIKNLTEIDNLQIEKLNEESLKDTLDVEGLSISEDTIETSKEIYRKMTLHALKTLVITKGLSSDPSKMKKAELLKLLESSEE
jgi:hypothetical protein